LQQSLGERGGRWSCERNERAEIPSPGECALSHGFLRRAGRKTKEEERGGLCGKRKSIKAFSRISSGRGIRWVMKRTEGTKLGDWKREKSS